MNGCHVDTIDRTVEDNQINSLFKMNSTIFKVKSIFSSNELLEDILFKISKEAHDKHNDKVAEMSYNKLEN